MVRIFIAVALLFAMSGESLAAQRSSSSKTTSEGSLASKLTIEQALEEAVQNNHGLLAECMKLTVTEASRITAGLSPNPLLQGSTHVI